MNFRVKIENIGKLDDVEIRIGALTVLAGPNNTGKSFVSKLLYSFFDAIKGDHVETYMAQLITGTTWLSDGASRDHSFDFDPDVLSSLDKCVEDLQEITKNVQIEDLHKTAEKIIARLEETSNLVSALQRSVLAEGSNLFIPIGQILTSLIESIEIFKSMNIHKLVSTAIGFQIPHNLEQNFQIPVYSSLLTIFDKPASISVDQFGKFDLKDVQFFLDNAIDLNDALSSLSRLRRYGNIIYLESPIYWKLKKSLEAIALDSRRTLRKRSRLNGVPGYFYDLARELTFGYLGDMAFPEVHRRLTSPEIIGGRVALTEEGSLNFHEDERIHPLSVTATGVANLGILALLIERRVLNENSLIFIDEPEAHLHPAWQTVMAKALFELARQGASVVIATHSMDILKWLEVHVKKHPEHEELIALNRFPTDDNDPDEDFEIKMTKIMEDLTKPFSDLYLEGL